MLAAGVAQAQMAIRIIQGNRLEVLAERLIADSAGDRLPPMAAQTVVVAHPGIGQWLREELALRTGVAAHLDLPLPGEWSWRVLRGSIGGLPERSAWSPLALAFRIDDCLAGAGRAGWLGRLADWPGLGEAAPRWRLARRLARRYDACLRHRGDWLLAWEAGRRVLAGEADEDWQARLWRRLVATTDEPHRARLLHRLAAGELRLDPAVLAPVVRVFGASQLAPAIVDFLHLLARDWPVVLYVPTPTVGWWADIDDPATRAAYARRRAALDQPDPEPDAQHPLLESLGTVGRDFQRLLYAGGAPIDEEELGVPPPGDSVLARVQASLLALDPARMRLEAPPQAGDRSLRIVACASVQREVEVVRDAVLRAFDEIPDLAPHEVAVLSPDPERYAGLIEAVFGDPGGGAPIPVHVADRVGGPGHALLAAWLACLDVEASRLRLHDVLALFDFAAVRARHGISADEVDVARHRLAAAGLLWGYDAAQRDAAGAGADATGTWQRTRDRLLVAHALGVESVCEVAGLVLDEDIGQPAARPVAAACALAAHLGSLRSMASTLDTIDGWRVRLRAHFDAMVVADDGDEDAAAARAALLAAFATLEDGALAAGTAARLPLAAVREELAALLRSEAGRPWIGAGVCVAGLVPLRSVPFRMIAVLGLDADGFPRREPPDPFDLARRHPRPGDRDRARDDLWLLVEALSGCRERLHLSWVARDPRSERARPPSPALRVLVDALLAGLDGEAAAQARAVLVQEAPAVPWDQRHYRAGDDWQTSDPRYAPAPVAAPQARFARELARSDGPPLTLADLVRRITEPARCYLQALGIAREDPLPESDEVDGGIDGLLQYRLRARFLAAALAGRDPGLEVARAIADGLLPPATAGAREGERLLESVVPLLDAAQDLRDAPQVTRRLRAIRGELQLHGGDTLLLLRPSRWSPQLLLADWIGLLALAREEQPTRLVAFCYDENGRTIRRTTARAPADPAVRDAAWDAVCALADALPRSLPPWLPRSAAAAASALAQGRSETEARARAASVWRPRTGGDHGGRGEGDDPAWQVAMRGRDPLDEAAFLDWARRIYLPLIAAMETQ